MKPNRIFLSLITALTAMVLLSSGCTDEPPDTSAPERIEIDRTSDWQGALLYIADSGGPVEGWGSIRIYDNVSGFVEATVEQTQAAAPSDVYVTDDGSKMYICSMANGSIDIFFWDGNGWRRGTRNIVTPSESLLAMDEGPDGNLYLTGSTPGGDAGAIYRLDPETDQVADEAITVEPVAAVRGITWPAGGATAYVTGQGEDGARLLKLEWPSGMVMESVALPVEKVNQPLAAPDEKNLVIACGGQLLLADVSTGAVTGSLTPSSDSSTDYYDVAFSADGLSLFAPGNIPGESATLYIIDMENGELIHEVTRVSVRANGIKRVE